MECVYTYCHGCSSGSEEKELTVSVVGGRVKLCSVVLTLLVGFLVGGGKRIS